MSISEIYTWIVFLKKKRKKKKKEKDLQVACISFSTLKHLKPLKIEQWL